MKPTPDQFLPLESNPSILKAILKESEDPSSEIPLQGSKVKILYKCRLSDFDTIVDQNESIESPFEFTVGEGNVIKGLDIGIQTMKQGERSVFQIPSKYAYGESGSGKIPKNETLHFEAELLELENPMPELPFEEKMEKANTYKAEGNTNFQKGQLDDALLNY